MKHELGRFCLDRLRQRGFSGRGPTLRLVGPDLQWVVRVEKVGHVDQVVVELGIVFGPAPPAGRNQCRVLWSLASFIGVESDDVARALRPRSDQTLEERTTILGDALDTAADVVHAHLTRARVAEAYRRDDLRGAFVFPQARELLESTPVAVHAPEPGSVRPEVAELVALGPMPTTDQSDLEPVRADRWEALVGVLYRTGELTDAESCALTPLFPEDDSDSYGVAWTLLHLVEEAPGWPLDDALEHEGPWVALLRARAGRGTEPRVGPEVPDVP